MPATIDTLSKIATAAQKASTRDNLSVAYDPTVTPVGVYKAKTGLRRWRASLGRCGKTVGGTGLGGADIVIIGDSIAEGAVATSYFGDRWSHRLKLKLQARYNPAGVLGGYGFVPALAGFQGGAGWPNVGFALWTHTGAWIQADTQPGVAARADRAISDQTMRARFAFDGTAGDAIALRRGIDKIEFVARHGSGGNGTWTWDVNDTDEFVTAGNGNRGTGTYINPTSPNVWGYHHGAADVALDPGDLNVVQVAGPASGSLWFDGAIAYNGDYDCGIRVHNLANWGTIVANYGAEDSLIANIDNWGAATTGASHAKLFVFNWITNDVGTGSSPVTAVATFKASYATQVERALACPSKPSVLLVIPPARGDSADAITFWPDFVQAIYEIADEHDHVAILDLWRLCDNTPYSGRVTELGWNHNSLVHYTDVAQEAWASILFDLLTAA